MQIELSAEERDTLAEVLDTYLSNLRVEIASTDSMDFREGLKAKKAVLMRIASALEASATEPTS